MQVFVWLSLGFCLTQSAMFSGLNLAFFSISRLRLQVESRKKNPHALLVADWRRDSNLLLCVILWGNVAINVIVALLSESVMTGLVAFVFSTVAITFLGEIVPQAYFSRHALRMAALLSPVLRVYKVLLYPVAKPSALMLDKWLGPESIHFYREDDLRDVLQIHVEAPKTEIERVEGRGAVNFLEMDDLTLREEGEPLDPASIMQLPFVDGKPVFPSWEARADDPFLARLHRSGKKWIILVDSTNTPRGALRVNEFMRDLFMHEKNIDPMRYCHQPLVIEDERILLREVLPRFEVHAKDQDDDVIDNDLILLWGRQRAILTGADILGRLMRGIVRNRPVM
jgi:hypothetical protein